MRKALVSLAIGKACLEPWQLYLRQGWTSWCEQHGYTLILFCEPLDASQRAERRSPAWQKLLAMTSPEVQAFDQALWVDADVLLQPWAPDPLVGLDPAVMAMARDVGSPLAHQPDWFKQAWCEILQHSLPGLVLNSYYDLWGVSASQRVLYNTGVIAFSPQHHHDLLMSVYEHWLDGGPGSLHEMIPLNLVAQQHGVLTELDENYNQLAGVQHAVWRAQPQAVQHLHALGDAELGIYEFLDGLARRCFFLHFAGAHQLMLRFLRQRYG